MCHKNIKKFFALNQTTYGRIRAVVYNHGDQSSKRPFCAWLAMSHTLKINYIKKLCRKFRDGVCQYPYSAQAPDVIYFSNNEKYI